MPRRGKRRAAASEAASVTSADGSQAPAVPPASQVTSSKRRKRATATAIKLSVEDEDRLGRCCSSADFLIKLAQGRGSSVCIHVMAMNALTWEDDLFKANLKTFDAQTISVVFRGQWIQAFGECLVPAKPAAVEQPILLSGHGGAISASGSSIVFESGATILKALDPGGKVDGAVHFTKTWVEVVKGVVQGTEVAGTPLPACAETPVRPRSLHPIVEETPTTEATPLPGPSRPMPAKTPDWLDTPVPVFPPPAQGNAWFPMTTVSPTNARSTSAQEQAKARQVSLATSTADRQASTESVLEPRTKKRDKAHLITKVKDIGGRFYTPLSEIPTQVCKHNVIGVMIADSSPRRASGGDQDWHIRIVLRDLHNLKVKGSACVTFNIFAKTEDALPICPDGSIIALVGIGFKPFNGKPQGIGRVGNMQWYLLSSQKADSNSVKVSGTFQISDEERKMIRGQHRIYREDFMNLGLDGGPVRRRLVRLCDVEADRFFDTHVEIVKIWDRSHPPTIYVTDYTSNPHFHVAQDVHLQVLSREEIHRKQLTTGDEGNGHVFAVSLWNAQIDAVPQLAVGMHVRLINVRPKKSMTGHLEGSIGGAYNDTEKLCIMMLADEDAGPIKQAKEAYSAKALATRAESEQALQAADDARLDASLDRGSGEASTDNLELPTGSPPAGQAVLQDTQARTQEAGDDTERYSSKSGGSASLLELERFIYTQLDGDVEHLPYTHLADIGHLAETSSVTAQARNRVFRCRVKIIDIKPRQLREFVRIRCGICQNTLPPSESMCKECADMDGKDLRHEYLFAMLICDAGNTAPATAQGRGIAKAALPLTVKGVEANNFFHHFHPRDVRERETTRARLQGRLAPLLGAKLAAQCETSRPRETPSLQESTRFSTPSSPASSSVAFDVGIVVKGAAGEPEQASGQKGSAHSYHLVHTRLIKAEPLPSEDDASSTLNRAEC